MPDDNMGALFEGKVIERRYRILKLLSQGNFGAVFHSRLEIFDEPLRDLAIKVTKQTQLDRDTAKSVFAEAILLTRLYDQIDDPAARLHIVPVYDLGLLEEHDRRGFIVMGLIRGIGSGKTRINPPDTLEDEIGRYAQGMPVDVALELFRQICLGMSAVHKLGIIHRDLKPDNILLTDSGQIRVVDFGLAAALDEIGSADGVAGTHRYMAPETARHGRSDSRSDVYSLGIILHEMLTGEYPFRHLLPPAGLSQDQRNDWVLQQKAKIHLSPPSSINSSVEPWLDRIVSDCLAFDANSGRPSNAGELLDLLNNTDQRAPVPEGSWTTWLNNEGCDWQAQTETLRIASQEISIADTRWLDVMCRRAICELHLGNSSELLSLLAEIDAAIERGAAATSDQQRFEYYDQMSKALATQPGFSIHAIPLKLKAKQARASGGF